MSGAARPASEAAVVQAGERRSARIESLRALAAVSVLVGHVVAADLSLNDAAPAFAELSVLDRLLYGGGLGVFFFFTLTGYLLFWPFVKRYWGSGSEIDVRRYALNRAVRILPLYFVVVAVALAFAEGATLSVWLRFFTFTENMFAFTAGQFIGPAWSLVVELHFYALLPILAWLLHAVTGRSLLRAAMVLLTLAAFSLALRYAFVYEAQPVNPLWRFNLPTTFLFFVPGMVLAMVRLRWLERAPRLASGVLGRADVWLAASIPLWLAVLLVTYRLDFLLCLASFLVVGACVLPLRGAWAPRALEWKPLVVVGVASYSLYLWHVPVLDVVLDVLDRPAGLLTIAALGVPASIAVALLSYRLIEAPFLRLREQWSDASAAQAGES